MLDRGDRGGRWRIIYALDCLTARGDAGCGAVERRFRPSAMKERKRRDGGS